MNSRAYNAGAQAAAEGFTGLNPYDADLAADLVEALRRIDEGWCLEHEDRLVRDIAREALAKMGVK